MSIPAGATIDEPDRTRLADIVQAFDNAGVRLWMDQGSLLGLVRDGKWIPWDPDIDLGVWRDDLAGKEWRILAALLRSPREFRVKFRPSDIAIGTKKSKPAPLPVQIAIYDRRGNRAVKPLSIPAEESIHHPGKGARILASLGSRIAYIGRLGARSLVKSSALERSRLLQRLLQGFIGLEIAGNRTKAKEKQWVNTEAPAAFFETLKTESISGVEIPLPHDAEGYLAFKYGETWRTPRRDWRYWEQDGAVTGSDSGTRSETPRDSAD